MVPDQSEVSAGFFGRRIEQLHDLARDLGQVHGAECVPSITGLDLGYPRDRGEHAQHAIELYHGVIDHRLIVIRLPRPAASFFQPAAHAGQRGTQVVRHIIGDLFHLSHQGFYAIEHQIEIFGELIPFISRSAQRYALAKAALHDRPAGRIDRFDPPHCTPGDGNAGHTGENKYQQDHKREGDIDFPREFVQVADVVSH